MLGALIEKQRTTPDAYPLTLNALRLACNQSTNRDPVVDYDEATVRAAAQRLGRRGWARFASGQGSGTAKYRDLVDDAIGLDGGELAVLCVLMLRGAQTPGELKGRTERMHPFASLDEVEDVLARLIERGFAAQLARRPGQKEERYVQILGGEEAEVPQAFADEAPAATAAADDGDTDPPVPASGGLPARVAALETEVAALREAVDGLRRELGA